MKVYFIFAYDFNRFYEICDTMIFFCIIVHAQNALNNNKCNLMSNTTWSNKKTLENQVFFLCRK